METLHDDNDNWSKVYQAISTFFYTLFAAGAIVIATDTVPELLKEKAPLLVYFLTAACLLFGVMFGKFHKDGIRNTFIKDDDLI